MGECMRELKKLSLWYTKTFRLITTHEKLESVMVTLGFAGLSPAPDAAGLTCKEYKYLAEEACRDNWPSDKPPRPKLPHPRLDGLHMYTYLHFLDTVNFYLKMSHMSGIFLVEAELLNRSTDRNMKWCLGEEDDGKTYVYREGTLDQATYNTYVGGGSRYDQHKDAFIRDIANRNQASKHTYVDIEDIIATPK